MPRPRFALAAYLLALLSLPSLSQDDVAARIVDLERRDPQVMAHVAYMTERIGPRLTGSPSLTRACEWARATFAALGLDARLEEWGTFPVGFERGPATGGMVAPVAVDYVFGTNAWTPGTPGPVRARAVLMPATADEVEASRDALSGAWVVDAPREGRPDPEQVRALRAALDGIDVAGRIRSAGSELIVTSGNPYVDWNDLPETVEVDLARSYYEDLVARLADGQEVELEFDIDNRFLPGPMPLYNVIADLEGSEHPDEYVVVGGHIDSWDGARGAQDNGTGCATTIEAARLLAEVGARPKRTIRFMLWSGEEQGLLGSRAYVEAHPDEMEHISAVLVHDGGTNYVSGISGPDPLVDQLQSAFEPVLSLESAMPFEVRSNGGLRARGASDHASFVAAGVPGFFWGQTGRADYRYVHHTQHDVLANVVPEYQSHSAMVIAIGAYRIADLPEMLDRTDLIAGARREPRRRIGVLLDETTVTHVNPGKAADAGWQVGDRILSIDGVDVADVDQVVAELQKGGPKKTIRLMRGQELVESVLDYADDPQEVAGAREAEKAAAEAAAKEKGEAAEGGGE